MSQFDGLMLDIRNDAEEKFVSSIDHTFDNLENIMSLYFNDEYVGYVEAIPEDKALSISGVHRGNEFHIDDLYVDESDLVSRETIQAAMTKHKGFAASAIFDELFIRWTKELDG